MDNQKIYEIIAEQCNVAVEEVNDNVNLKDDYNLDSLDLFQIVMALEEAYEIEIPTEDVDQIKTVGDVINYIKSHVE